MRRALLALMLMVMGTAAQASVAPVQPYRIAYQDRLVTDVYINGSGPFTFVIDTASSQTIIYEHIRKRMQLAVSDPEPIIVYGINQAAKALAVAPDNLTVAGQQIRGLTMGVLPDSEQRGDPDGVLGIDVLSRYFEVLDRSAMQFKLLPREGDAAKAFAGWDRMTLTPRPLKNIPVDFWYVNTSFNGHPMPALFDLGSGLTLLNWDAAERLGVEKHTNARRFGPPPEQFQDVLGQVAPAVVVKEIRIGLEGQAWQKQDVLVSDAPVFDFFGMGDRPGAIIGPGLLRNNSLAIDFAGGKLYVGPLVPGD